ncbi:MAG: type I restriction endonuclease subunit R [Thermodesulfobacteriota bacterium]
MPRAYSEDILIEQPAIALFASLGWQTANLYHEFATGRSVEGREGKRDVFLPVRLRAALEKLNPGLPAEGIDQALDALTRDRSKMIDVNANREVYQLLKGGVKVTVPGAQGGQESRTARVIDWTDPGNNDLLLASQVWFSSELYDRRADLVGFVNGIPLLFMELKATHRNVKDAYDKNLTDYRSVIPHVFIPNGIIILSNGSETRLGSTFAGWEHFVEWKKAYDETEEGVVSLETVIRGTCSPARLLDIVENFTVFEAGHGGFIKKVAKNHQYLGVNRAIEAVRDMKGNQGRLGVFWHTQGSGKSLSMVFFTQKILRKFPGNWTFVIVTDRNELDHQIYKTFAATGAVTEAEAHAESGAHLRQLLTEDHRYVFTLIQKFKTDKGKVYPALSEREDIIVITDEAHRSQYDIFAMNMRSALPKASFLGFTGTPLMAGEEKTKDVFGEYVSVYNFTQSIQDRATVPLYYENRIPELQLKKELFNERMHGIIENADLDAKQEAKLEREIPQEYKIITRKRRLNRIAEDLVKHFVSRGHRGKAMMICIDKATAVRMYDNVQRCWQERIVQLRADLEGDDPEAREVARATIAEMERTDMAVVVSQAQNEVKDLKDKGLDIRPHRMRMRKENLDEKFKDPNDPLRLVFVCAMWITGFDVPECSTIYLDKPMRNHSLMQTIARANRVTEGKEAGLIVDYIGIFRNLQKALAIYAAFKAGEDEETPILDKHRLVEFLKQAIAETASFLLELGVGIEAIKEAEAFVKVKLLDDAVEEIIRSDETRKQFLNAAAKIARMFKAIKPDPVCYEVIGDVAAVCEIGKKIKALAPTPDISEVMRDVEGFLDDSIATEGYIIPKKAPGEPPYIDLSKVDFDKLRKKFKEARKRSETLWLRVVLENKLADMIQQNRARLDYLEKFQKLIAEYNSGAKNIEQLFEELIRFAQSLKEEEQRAMREELTEEELAVFDILTKPEPKLTKKQETEIKKTVRELLDKLKREKLVLDWQKQQKTKAMVKFFIEEFYAERLPETYDDALYRAKCDLTYQYVYDVYGMQV